MRRAILAVAVLLSSAPAFAAKLERGPYLQQTTATSAQVVLRTDAPAQVELESGGVAVASSSGTEHVLKLAGLTPGSEVTYSVRLDGVRQGPWTFRTPGLAGTPAGGRAVLGVIGDMGSGGDNERANVQQMARRGVELVLTVGDNVYPHGAPEEYDPKFFEPFAPLLPSATVYPALGDHEYHTPGATGFLGAFHLPDGGPGGERYYSFDWGDLHVSVLDSQCLDPTQREDGEKEVPPECAQMVPWLEADLAATPARWRLVTVHRQAVGSGSYGHSAKVAKALLPVFERHGVDLVFQGNTHFYERSWPMLGGRAVKESYEDAGAPVYVTTGGGGDWIYPSDKPQPDWSAFRETEFQHLQLTLEDRTLKVDSVRPDGTLLDSFTLKKSQ